MKEKENPDEFTSSLEANMKKALTELMVLRLLSQREHYISEMTKELKDLSGGALSIVFPYGAVYRLCDGGYIAESSKRVAPDGRLRQYYCITERGLAYLEQLLETYYQFSRGVEEVLNARA